jgi:hypothetical protein
MKQSVDALSSDRLWCNTAGTLFIRAMGATLEALLPPFAASTTRKVVQGKKNGW